MEEVWTIFKPFTCGCNLTAANGNQIDLIHDSRLVGFAIIMQTSYTLLRGANNTTSRGYNEHLSHTDDLFHFFIVHLFIECLSAK